MDKGLNLHTISKVHDTDSFWSVDLMTAGRKHINMAFIHIDWHMSICLYRICMEENLMLLRDLANLLDWLDASDLVICKHHRNQNCILAD